MAELIFRVEGAPAGAPFLRAEAADTFLSRFRGLMGRATLPPGRGLLLTPCNSVHMCFMRFAIDVIYLDADDRVLKVVQNLWPWLGLSLCPGARAALEVTAGEAARLGIEKGRRLLRQETAK